ncbi:MAG: SDR family NAD(P)-dependent oxidoreductase [Actinomycetota bacterium]|nr:SDR family NAD(P)-dependent oxidoreductase [Actinomycetota bacterium]
MSAADTAAAWWAERSDLAGRVAILTGGAGGLGEMMTLDLQANGCKVAIVDRDEAAIEAIRSELTTRGADFLIHVGDARDPDVLDALFAATAERWGRLDILVNIVGGTFKAPFEGSTPKAWDTLLRTNLMHVLHASSRAIPAIKAGGRGGSIINITTIEGYRAAPNFAVYSAAKAAVAQFTRSLSLELAPDGIRVNCVAPDLAPTPGMKKISAGVENSMNYELGQQVAIPMGRTGTMTDISDVVVFLASGLSKYITGSTLHPDGGTFTSAGWFNWPGDGYGNTLPMDVMRYLEQRGE